MGVIFKIAIRNMKRRKARYILTTITLVIGVALFGGILIARDSFKVMFVKDIDNRMGTADILIRESELHDGWFRPSALEDIEDLPHIDYISYRIAGFDVYTSWTPNGNQIENSTRTSVYGIDIESDDEEELGSRPYIIDSDVDGDTIEELLDEGLSDYGKNTIVITMPKIIFNQRFTGSFNVKVRIDIIKGINTIIAPTSINSGDIVSPVVISSSKIPG